MIVETCVKIKGEESMKKRVLQVIGIVFLAVLMVGCTNKNQGKDQDSTAKTKIVKTENGDLEIPKNPKKVIVNWYIHDSVYLDGADIQRLKTKEIAKKMTILPQTPTAPNGLTVSELVAYGRFPHQKEFGKLTEADKQTIQWALTVTKLNEFENREVDSLSGGQRQRVWIAMALTQQTELILLDEPTTYLDMAHQLEILELLEKLNHEEGCTIAMVLHDLNLAARFVDEMIAIHQGNIVAHGTPFEVMTPDVLKKVFQIDAQIVTELLTGCPVCLTYHLIAN